MICFFFIKSLSPQLRIAARRFPLLFSVKKRRNIAVHICVLCYFFQRADIVFRHFSDNYFVVGQTWKSIKQIHNQSFSPLIFCSKSIRNIINQPLCFFPTEAGVGYRAAENIAVLPLSTVNKIAFYHKPLDEIFEHRVAAAF